MLSYCRPRMLTCTLGGRKPHGPPAIYSVPLKLYFNCVERSPWDANSLSSSQGIPPLLWTTNAHYRGHMRPLLKPDYLRTILTIYSYLLQCLPGGRLSSGLRPKFSIYFWSLPCAMLAPPISYSIWQPSNIWRRAQTIKIYFAVYLSPVTSELT